jgi:hypothetical protein
MSSAWRDARGALSWGFWLGITVAMVVLTLDAILRGAAAEPDAAARIDQVALWQRTAIGFAGGFGAGAFAHLYLRGLEKKAELRRR